MLTHRISEAFAYAVEAHAGQCRKGSEVPYVAHVMAVSALVLEHGGDESVAIAGLLHDVVEDCGGEPRLNEIRTRFGERVAEIVAGCTDTDQTPKPPWQARKEAYLAHLPSADAGTQLVSCCDKLHNARSIVADLRACGAESWNKFSGGRDGTLWYYASLVAIYRASGLDEALVDELARTVDEMRRLSGAAV